MEAKISPTDAEYNIFSAFRACILPLLIRESIPAGSPPRTSHSLQPHPLHPTTRLHVGWCSPTAQHLQSVWVMFVCGVSRVPHA
jgi:hypothetical protein